ncbi:MAG: hypothetical protein BWY95_02383 [Bacteroidetes bacterium ADurb.BinA104]|nr:MAG: hypothetical protein BWY95_02383 [Bacteroidetes bacterium ADurb.BinA104]
MVQVTAVVAVVAELQFTATLPNLMLTILQLLKDLKVEAGLQLMVGLGQFSSTIQFLVT